MSALSDCIEAADVPEKRRQEAREELAALRDVVKAAEKAGPEPTLIRPLRAALAALRDAGEC